MDVHEDHHKAGRILMPALEKRNETKIHLSPVAPSGIEPGESKDAPSVRPLPDEATAPETQEAPTFRIDSERVRKVIVDIAAEEQRKEDTSGMALRTQRSAAEKAISQAARPKCENGDAARVGNAQFTGLMKLPLLMLGAVRDQGCKW